MSASRRVWCLGALHAALTLVGCAEDEARDVLDAGSWGDLDGALTEPTGRRDSGRYPDGAGPDTPPTLGSASATLCLQAPLPAPPDSCGERDLAEPSTERDPARLEVTPSCGLVLAQAADKDQDAYRFAVDKSDPVRVELSYRTDNRADLSLAVHDLRDNQVASVETRRTSALEHEQLVFPARAGTSYDVRVEGDLIGTCLPYALRVDTRYCSDTYEDNDNAASANKLMLDADSKVELDGTISDGDADFFELITPRADPVRIYGAYSVSSTDTLQLRRSVSNTSGLGGFDVTGARVGLDETFSHWLLSNTKGAVFRAQLVASGSGCARYRLGFDVAACTDEYEDNDSAAEARLLPPEQTLDLTIFRNDDDHYDLSALPRGGTCTVSYTVAAESTDTLRLTVFRGSTNLAGNSGSSAAGDKRVSVSWAGAASTLQITGSNTAACLSYELRCEQDLPPVQ